MTADRASLSDVTINGLRTVKDQMKVHGRPHEVPITSGLLLASREAHQAHEKRVSGEEEAERVQKLEANQEAERRKEEEIVKQKEAEKLEESRKKLAEEGKQLRKSEDQKESELQAAKKPSMKKEVNGYQKRLETEILVMLPLLQGCWKLPRREWIVLWNKQSRVSVNESYLKVQGREF